MKKRLRHIALFILLIALTLGMTPAGAGVGTRQDHDPFAAMYDSDAPVLEALLR